MRTIERLKAEIIQLTAEELTELAHWLSERHWESWDAQIEADSQAGRLDFLIDEVQTEKSEGRLTDL
jgi:hypothetical protein